MFDNLRRSLLTPAIFFLLIVLFLFNDIEIAPWIYLILASFIIPNILPFISGVFSYQKKIPIFSQLYLLLEELIMGMFRVVLNITFLPYQSWLHIDAIGRTIVRLAFTKKKLLEWTTSAASKSSASIELRSFFNRMMKMEVAIILISLMALISTCCLGY